MFAGFLHCSYIVFQYDFNMIQHDLKSLWHPLPHFGCLLAPIWLPRLPFDSPLLPFDSHLVHFGTPLALFRCLLAPHLAPIWIPVGSLLAPFGFLVTSFRGSPWNCNEFSYHALRFLFRHVRAHSAVAGPRLYRTI